MMHDAIVNTMIHKHNVRQWPETKHESTEYIC